MKLKKLAALALAGVMAVSMLTACGNGNGGAPDNGGENGVATGYSSVLAKYMTEASKMDNVTFQDSSDDAAALEDALGNRGTLLLSGDTIAPVPLPVVSSVIAEDFKRSLGMDNVVTDVANTLLGDGVETVKMFFNNAGDVNEPKKIGMLFVVDGTISVEKALRQLGMGIRASIGDVNYEDLWNKELWQGITGSGNGSEAGPRAEPIDSDDINYWLDWFSLDTIVAELPESMTNEYGTTWHYDYTISASVINKALTVFENYNGSANYIAITITRTVK